MTFNIYGRYCDNIKDYNPPDELKFIFTQEDNNGK